MVAYSALRMVGSWELPGVAMMVVAMDGWMAVDWAWIKAETRVYCLVG